MFKFFSKKIKKGICFESSTPDLDNLESRLLPGFQLLQLYKAPPPYRDPLMRPNSNSTPDLASQTYGPLRTAFNKPQVRRWCLLFTYLISYFNKFVNTITCNEFI